VLKNKALSIIALSLVLVAAPRAYAGDAIGLRTYVNRSSITIGDRIKYTVEVTAPHETQIQMPAFKDNLIGEFEIKDSASKTTEHLFGKKRLRSRYDITAYSVGKKEIPSIEIKYKPRLAKDWSLKKTDVIAIDVRSVLPKEPPVDIRGIKGPAGFFEINWFLVGLACLGLVILISALTVYIRIRNRKPIRLPHETALEELEAIRSQLINTGLVKEYFVGVSDCVRRYIERVFRLKAPEMTSEEFLNSLHDSTVLAAAHKELLKGFMNACDLVKFAKYSPTGEEAENVYATAKNFIEETKDTK
jgi:hypothetical protein